MRYTFLRLVKLCGRIVIIFGVPATVVTLMTDYHRPSNAALIADTTGADVFALIDERTAEKTSRVNDYA